MRQKKRRQSGLPDRCPACCAGIINAFLTVTRAEGSKALFKGLGPALIGIAPFAAINFASYDLLKRNIFGADARCRTAHPEWDDLKRTSLSCAPQMTMHHCCSRI